MLTKEKKLFKIKMEVIMRLLYIFFVLLVIMFASCKLKEIKHIQKNELAEISIEENIFEYLFSDVPYDYNEYKNKIGYEITEKYNDYYSETQIIVKHECFYVLYSPNYKFEKNGNSNQGIFIRDGVEINKKTHDIILGEYIGENIEVFLKKYTNKIEAIYKDYKDESRTYYRYGYYINSDDDYIKIVVGINVINNIIEKIYYGYLYEL
jgi:hypothetical protein